MGSYVRVVSWLIFSSPEDTTIRAVVFKFAVWRMSMPLRAFCQYRNEAEGFRCLDCHWRQPSWVFSLRSAYLQEKIAGRFNGQGETMASYALSLSLDVA